MPPLKRKRIRRAEDVAFIDKSLEPKRMSVGFGSFSFSFPREDALVLILIGFTVAVLYIFWDFRKEAVEAHRLLAEQNAEMAFLISKTPEERAALGIEMPESLARKLHRQRMEKQQEDFKFRRQSYDGHP